GTFTVQEFLQFYMRDVVAGGAETHSYRFFGVELAREAPAATSFFILALLVGALLSSLAAGKLSSALWAQVDGLYQRRPSGADGGGVYLRRKFRTGGAHGHRLRPGLRRLSGGRLGTGERCVA